MKTRLYSLVAVLVLFGGSTRGQAILSFSGGNGAPLTVTLSQPVAYLITSSTPPLSGPWFLFQNVGNIFAGGFDNAGSSTFTFSINGGPAHPLTSLANNLSSDPADLTLLSSSQTGATIGDLVQLNAGTFTTSVNVAVPAPANGSYNTYVIDNNGTQRSGFGVAVPEPQSVALLVSGGLGILFALRRGRKTS